MVKYGNTVCPKNRGACVIEQVTSYGMPVGAEVFETVFWSGRFAERFGADQVQRIPRLKVKLHICLDSHAKDANVRQALIDRFGKPGTKASPGVLYGISGDLWAAVALAVTWWDLNVTNVEGVSQTRSAKAELHSGQPAEATTAP